ncbi:MAG: cobalt ECF transporter T component CbiQ [Hormoscilla sp. SP5CHS1]|nr:cobalt ECF transporter T component CbiQ [Hormoscilla sp. SP5CHS1]
MKLGLDSYAYLKSPIHRWEPRCKLVGLMALIFAFSGVQHLGLLPGMAALAIALYRVSQLPISFLLRRLRYPSFFLLGMVGLLPFVAGDTVIFSMGPLALRLEGCLAAVLITTRFLCIFTVALVILGTTPFLTSIKAMRGLGLPSVLADMMLLSYRYLEELGDRLRIMKLAMKLRGFRGNQPSYRNLRVLASLVGTLLVRSYEQSERVYQAMRLRGYGQSQSLVPKQSVSSWDLVFLGVSLAIAAASIAASILW